MKAFKDLKVGDKVFLGVNSLYVQHIKYMNGYLEIIVHPDQDRSHCSWNGWVYYIPFNHIHANQVKTKHGQLMLSIGSYRKYMNKFINEQINR